MLRFAIPKGRLEHKVLNSLKRIGYRFSQENARNYSISLNEDLGTLFKVRAIPQLLALGFADVGFSGLDIVREANLEQLEVLVEFPFAKVTIVVATHHSTADILQNPPQRPLVIATEYPELAGAWAVSNKLAHIILNTYGSTEAYVPHIADIHIDCCETGDTIDANKQVILETLFSSSTVMLTSKSALAHAKKGTLIRKLQQKMEILSW